MRCFFAAVRWDLKEGAVRPSKGKLQTVNERNKYVEIVPGCQ